MARLLSLLWLVVLGPSLCAAEKQAAPRAAERVVFLGHPADAEQLVVLGAALAASRHPGVFLLDSERARPHLQAFLKDYQPTELISVGAGAAMGRKLRNPLNLSGRHIDWRRGPPFGLWAELLPQAKRVVVCPQRPYRLLLQAACLAGLAQAPLYVFRDNQETRAELLAFLNEQGTHWIYAVGDVSIPEQAVAPWRVKRFQNEKAVQAACVRRLKERGPIRDLIVANPADRFSDGAMSPLAPWLAVSRRGLLLLSNASGSDVAAIVEDAERRFHLCGDHLLLAADLAAIPVERRLNPVRGKDEYIEMEPTTPTGTEPYTYAVGRLFHQDPAVVNLMLAGQRLWRPRAANEPFRALVASNSAGELPLLETFSRTTAKELGNRGFQTTAFFGDDVNPGDLRRLLPRQDIFLWEGHHNTLIKNYGFPEWDERLQPGLFFLQSCLVLQPEKTASLFERGVLGVVGSSTRIYSASGGAFALSYFNALLYERQTLGGSLRHAKNFLVCYAQLKEKRLGSDARLTAVNLRSAWAFSLWGDPGLKLPLPARPEDALPAVKPRLQGNTIRLRVPEETHESKTKRYRAEVPANGRLAGLVVDEDKTCDRLVPLLFAEVELPSGPAGATPRLRTKLPDHDWTFCWDGRRHVAYLLVAPGQRDDLRFHVEWDSELIGGE
ncbi:MAG: hypothetical protein AB7K24_12045 [Gemmataceae bacterium]